MSVRGKGKVSVLITSYNFSKFVEEAIHSTLQQDYKNIEIIIADDCSTDGTQQIISTLSKKFPVIIPVFSDENKGFSHNINQGLKRCSGEYVALLSGDDRMLPGKLSKQTDFLDRHKEYGICTHDAEVFDDQSQKVLYRMSDRFRMHAGKAEEILLCTNWLFRREIKNIPSSIMGRSELFLKHQFDERFKCWHDTLFILDCLATSKLTWGHIPEVLGRYRLHANQAHTSKEVCELSFEEMIMLLSIASVRYPELSRSIRNKRDYVLFQHLVFDWHSPEKRPAFERQFIRNAGFWKWFYMKLCHFYLRLKKFFQAT